MMLRRMAPMRFEEPADQQTLGEDVHHADDGRGQSGEGGAPAQFYRGAGWSGWPVAGQRGGSSRRWRSAPSADLRR